MYVKFNVGSWVVSFRIAKAVPEFVYRAVMSLSEKDAQAVVVAIEHSKVWANSSSFSKIEIIKALRELTRPYDPVSLVDAKHWADKYEHLVIHRV